MTADWLLLRYADADGNWLVITQGYGGLLIGLASAAPRPTGDSNSRVAEARWINGRPGGAGWEADTLIQLSREVGRFGGGWSITPGGEPQTGGPQGIALGSNVLALNQLVEVAESLE